MKNYRAFTLIELLVVISIIALLVSILMPALNKARQQATGAVCLANQRTMGQAWVMYYDDNDGLIASAWTRDYGDIKPWAYQSTAAGPLELKKDAIRNGTLFPYIENVEAYHCPGDKRSNKLATCPGWTNNLGGYRSYSIPGGLFGAPAGGDWGYFPIRKASDIKRPSEKYVFIEETDNRGGNLDGWSFQIWDDPPSWCDPLALWHNDASTLGFCDGHAEMHRWVDKSTFDMLEIQQIFYPTGDPGDEGIDMAYMAKGYAFKGLR